MNINLSCQTPIANSVSLKFPYAGVIHSCVEFQGKEIREKVLGPVYARIFGKDGIGILPPGSHHKAPLLMFLTVIPFMVKGLLLKKAKPNPFFDEISKAEREQAKLQS